MTRPILHLQGVIIRDLCVRWRGLDLLVQIDAEGIRVKGRGQHWDSAPFLSWASLYDIAVEIRAQKTREQRAARKRQRQEGRRR